MKIYKKIQIKRWKPTETFTLQNSPYNIKLFENVKKWGMFKMKKKLEEMIIYKNGTAKYSICNTDVSFNGIFKPKF